MPGFVLTPERRNELVELLSDEVGFKATYPRAADYLTTAAGLAGTGAAEVDDAFDLRFLHFMAGGESETGNPYWDIVGPLVNEVTTEKGRRRIANGGSPDGSARLAYAETLLQATYSYAVPSPETLSWVAQVCEGRPLVEIGAGRGYWAWLLSRLGAAITAYDNDPPADDGENTWFPPAAGQPHTWYPVGGLKDLASARRCARGSGREGEHVLFLCWPPAWGDPMASRALRAYERAGGDRLVYVGEPKGGKSGDDAFFDSLSERWRLIDEDARFVSWWNLNDCAQCWVRA